MTQKYTPIDHLVKKHKQENISLQKEREPSSSSSEKFHMQEVVEHEPEEEVKPFVHMRKETIEIPSDLKKFGLKPTGSTNFSGYKNIKLPLSDDKIIIGLHAPVTSSIRWLATLALYLLQQVHLTLKVVRGRVVRVIRK